MALQSQLLCSFTTTNNNALWFRPTQPSLTITIRSQKASSSSDSSSSNLEEPKKPGVGFGSSNSNFNGTTASSSSKRKQKKGGRERASSIIRRSPIEKPAFVFSEQQQQQQQQQQQEQSKEQSKNESAFLLAWLGFGAVILVEGISLAASGFLPEEWDKVFVKYLYPSFTPTVFLFVAGTVAYGVFKYLQNDNITQQK